MSWWLRPNRRGTGSRRCRAHPPVLAALTASGLSTDQFTFMGYPPRRRSERQRWFEPLRTETSTVILFEAPHRLAASFEDLRQAVGGDRRAALCRELTKLHETIDAGTLDELASSYGQTPARGECTLIVAGASSAAKDERWTQERVRRELRRLQQQGLGAKQASSSRGAESGWPRNRVYPLALEER